ncbi:MAG: Thymidylate kinase [Candidatus Woesearchaeota archaeon]|nr:Thymidylate kinase [Candidatus Woesearchaeota archaeon]
MLVGCSQIKGKLIVIDGLDGSGKFTQFKRLKQRLQKKGYRVVSFDFPQYDKTFGALVAKYLRGEFGDMDELPVEIPSILYALDRYSVRDDIERALSNGNIVILNRYSPSNLGFQGAKLEGKARVKLIKWIDVLEARLPKPDLVIFLDVPRKFTRFLMGNKDLREYLYGEEQDIHEKNDDYQIKVEAMYRELVRKRKSWVRINCIKHNDLLSIEKIHKLVWKTVKRII